MTGFETEGSAQRVLFDDEVDAVRAPSAQALPASATVWKASLTHRLRVLLHATPLFDLRAGDPKRDEQFRHYDSLALAVKLFDELIERSGFEDDLDRSGVIRILSPVLQSMDSAANRPSNAERHEQMVDRLLAALRNDKDGRRPFQVEYADIDEQGKAVRRTLSVRLLADHFHPAGGTVLRLSSEAINLFLGALELEIEDAQAAAEAIVQSQIARGKFDQAVNSARNASLYSIRLRDKIRTALRDTARDIDRVDWRQHVPTLISEALGHISQRLDAERSIISTTQERLELIGDEDGTRKSLIKISQLISDCQYRHMELHRDLMRARNVFLDAQERQQFNKSSILLSLPELEQDVLTPILGMGRDQANEVLETSVPKLLGAKASKMFSVTALVRWQLRPKRSAPKDAIELVEADLGVADDELLRFTPQVREEVRLLLTSITEETRLSQLLTEVRDAGRPTEVLEALVIAALQHFAPDNQSKRDLMVERIRSEELDDPSFFGDDLVLTKPEAIR